MKTYKIAIIGVKEDTNKLLQEFANDINLCITLHAAERYKYDISGGLTQINSNVQVFYSDSYVFNSPVCKQFFSKNQFDIGIVLGWQRIIPKYVLDCFNVGVFGWHASPLGLPFGKGRSPLNWSTILGFDKVYNHCFKYNKNVDDGMIYKTTILDILPWDTISSLREKNLIDIIETTKNLLNDYHNDTIQLIEQDTSIPESYFPKRTAMDGKIDLTKSTIDIFNLIRGCSKPFPGAFLYVKNTNVIVKIWKAVPYSFKLFNEAVIGEIVYMSDQGPILKTKDGTLLITEYEYELKLGDNLV